MNYEELQNKFQEIQNKSKTITASAVKINTQIETSQETFQKMQETALKKFGTSDIEELKAMSALWKQQNEERIEAYETAVNKIAAQVSEKNQLIQKIQQS